MRHRALLAIGLVIVCVAGFLFVKQLRYELSLKHEVDGLVWQQIPADCHLGDVRFYVKAAAQQLVTQCVAADELQLGQQMKLFMDDEGDVAARKGKWLMPFAFFVVGLMATGLGYATIRWSSRTLAGD